MNIFHQNCFPHEPGGESCFNSCIRQAKLILDEWRAKGEDLNNWEIWVDQYKFTPKQIDEYYEAARR